MNECGYGICVKCKNELTKKYSELSYTCVTTCQSNERTVNLVR